MKLILTKEGKVVAETDVIYTHEETDHVYANQDELDDYIGEEFGVSYINGDDASSEERLASEWIKENTSEQFQA